MLLKIMMLKKPVYDHLAAKVNNIDTNDFVLKTKYQTDKTELVKKFLILKLLIYRIKYQTYLNRKQNSRR